MRIQNQKIIVTHFILKLHQRDSSVSWCDKKAFLEKLLPYIQSSAIADFDEAKRLSSIAAAVAYMVDIDSDEFSPVLIQLKAVIIAASKEWQQIELYIQNHTLMQEHPSHFSPEEVSVYSSLSLKYLENANDDYQQRGLDELDEYKDNLKQLAGALGINEGLYL